MTIFILSSIVMILYRLMNGLHPDEMKITDSSSNTSWVGMVVTVMLPQCYHKHNSYGGFCGKSIGEICMWLILLTFVEFYQGWVYSKTLFHSQTKCLTNDFAPLNPSQIFSLFRKWCTSPSKVPKITAYAITSDVIGHDVTLHPDISD